MDRRYLLRQLKGISEDGPGMIYSKVKKNIRLLFMSLFAPAAVYFRIDWSEAYDFLIRRISKKIKKLRLQSNPQTSLLSRLIEEAINCLVIRTKGDPGLAGFPAWMKQSVFLGNLYLLKNEMNFMDVYKRIAKVQANIIRKHQLDVLGMEFIPRALPQGSIGVYEYLEIYIKARMLDSRPDKRMFLLLPPNTPVTNLCYLKYWSKYFTIMSDPAAIKMFEPLEGVLTVPFISFINFRNNLYKSELSQGIVREQWRQGNRPKFFTLSKEDHDRGWECLRSLGLPKDAWFVTLHVREPGWRDRGAREENFRNADIKTYIPAIRAITDAGGWVVRIGDRGMGNLPVMDRLVDYAHSDVKSDWMDIFLCAQCRFMIGTSSGMCTIASMFGVPLVMTNLLPEYAVYHFTSQDLFIIRFCFSKDEGRYLSFSELISPPVGTAKAQSHFDGMNLQIVENSAEEIKALVEEMLERQNSTVKYTGEDEILQKRFREITAHCGEFYDNFGLVSQARLGREFLRTHADLLDMSKGYQEQTDLLVKR